VLDDLLYAVDVEGREVLWMFEAENKIDSSPVNHRNKVFVRSKDGYIYGLNEEDGGVLWRKKFKEPFRSGTLTNFPIALADDILYLGTETKQLYALDPQTGIPIWIEELEAACTSGIVAANGEIYIPSGGYLYALTLPVIASIQPRDKIITLWGNVKRNSLLQNYPNPFNPDTWIPYQLAEDSYIGIRIYDSTGKLVRKLNLGNKPAGFYIDKSDAAYWDGRNEAGEQVSSGIYFYTILASKFAATRKMVIAR
jgi:outer membrane protein assembly factor BamB